VTDPGSTLPTFLTCAEVARMLRVSERTLETWRLKNWGPRYIRMGSGGKAKVLYDLCAILAWLKNYERGQGI